MTPVSEGLKSWIELIEKLFLVIALIVGLVASGYKGYDYLSKKADIEVSKRHALKLLINTHENMIRNIDAQVSAMDAELSTLPINSKLWKSKEAVRKMKSEDRRVLLFNLESQVFLHEEYMAGKRKK